MEGLCGSEIFPRSLCVQAFYPPGGTLRLYGRHPACRCRKAAKCRRILQDLPDVSTAHRYARSVLEMRQSSGCCGNRRRALPPGHRGEGALRVVAGELPQQIQITRHRFQLYRHRRLESDKLFIRHFLTVRGFNLRPAAEIGGAWLLKRPADPERLQDVPPTKVLCIQKPDRIVQ